MSPARKRVSRPVDLRRRWRVALADAGMTETAWAISRGLTQSHVRQVVLGTRESPRITEIIAFIEQQERVLARRLNVSTAA